MNKERTPLQALQVIKNSDSARYYCVEIDIIETALKRLKNYERNEDFSKDVLNYAFLNEQDKIKKLKALEIIKNMNIIIQEHIEGGEIIICCKTKNDFNLLKEVLL